MTKPADRFSPKPFLIASTVLFVLACALPALEFKRNEAGIEVWEGIQVAFIGGLGLLLGQFAWLANPLLLGAWLSLLWRRRIPTVLCASLALLVGTHTFALFGQSIPADEANVSKLSLSRLREGTWLWFGSMGIVLTGGLLARMPPRSVSFASAMKQGSAEMIRDESV